MNRSTPSGAELLAELGEVPQRFGRLPGDLQEFVTERVQIAGSRGPDRDRQEAFLALLMSPGSKLDTAVRAASKRAHARCAGALLPYVEFDDIYDLVRWRLATLRADYFSAEGPANSPGILGFIFTVARNIALDELRRMSRRAPRSGYDVPLSDDGPASDTEVFDEVRDAVHHVMAHHPTWARQPWLEGHAINILVGARPADEMLAAINTERERQGERPWARGTLASFRSRLRADVRAELARRTE